MILCAAGDTHGQIDRFYGDLLAFEESLGVRFDYVLHVGDFGVWPDPARIDRATARHEGAGDFQQWLQSGKPVPRRTVFIKGNHEDFEWLEERRGKAELLPSLRWLPNGRLMELENGRERLRLGGLGGCYGPRDYAKSARALRGKELAHYVREEIEGLSASPLLDVLLMHDAPKGIAFQSPGHRKYESVAEGLGELVTRLRPTVCFFGHHHVRVHTEVGGVPVFGLNLVGRAGHLVAFEVGPSAPRMRLVGEWP